MFKRDQKEISDYALSGPDPMARVITFVYLTIRQSITSCEDQGGAEFLWDNWCRYVGERNGYSADAISAMHTKALGL